MKENTKDTTMKVSDLSKELNVQSKEVLEFLREKGFDYGSAAKKISEEEVAMVRAKFGGTSAKNETPEKAEKTEKKAAEKPAKAEAPEKSEKAESKPAEKTEAKAAVKPAAAPAVVPAPAPGGEAPKKKKTIIMVGKNIPQK